MARIQYFTACTLDGFIADENDSLDWLYEVPHDEEDGYWDQWFPSVGGLVMGATTYEWMLEHGGPDSWRNYYGERPGWVFTHRELPLIPDVELSLVEGEIRPVYEQLGETTIRATGVGSRDLSLAAPGGLATSPLRVSNAQAHLR